MAVDMNRHDRSRARRKLFLKLTYIHAPRSGLAIDKNRNTVVVSHRLRAGDDGETWHDDFVARLKLYVRNRHLKRDSAITDSNSIAPPAVCGPTLFKCFDKPACRGNPPSAYAFGDVF